jgi:hypothetical protein
LIDCKTSDKIFTERDELIKERDELKSKLILLKNEEKEELCFCLCDYVDKYRRRVSELELELKAHTSPSETTFDNIQRRNCS